MTKQEFINKTLIELKIDNANQDRLSSQLDIYKTFLQEQNAITNLTRLDKEEMI